MGHENFEHTMGGEHNYSEKPEDNGWAHLNSLAKERELNIVGLLGDLEINKTKREIIGKAISNRGMAWNDLLDYENAPKATKALTHMVAHWDTPLETGPKTEQDHKEEAENFARLLSQEI